MRTPSRMNCVRQDLRLCSRRASRFTTDGIPVGDYIADLVVEGTVVVELKASKALDPAHTAQCINYLKATGLHLCLLLNFAKPRLQIHRIAHEL